MRRAGATRRPNFRGVGRTPPPSGSAPVNTVAPVVSGTVVVGQTLSTTNGTWSNSPTSYTYQWRRGGANIGGATSSTYTVVSADCAVTTIDCVVTATNGSGSTSQASSNALSFNPGTMLTGVWGAWEADNPGNSIIGGAYDTWADLSSYGNTLSAPASGNRPTYEANGLGTGPCAFFNGSSHVLRNLATAAVGSQPTAASIILIGTVVSTGTTVHVHIQSSGAAALHSLGAASTGLAPRHVTSGTGGATTIGTTNLGTAPRLYWGAWTGGSPGTQTTGTGTAAEGTPGSPTIVYSNYDGGRIGLGATPAAASFISGRWGALYVMRAAVTTNELSSILARAQSKGWL